MASALSPYLAFVQGHPWMFAALALVTALLIANEVHGTLTGGRRLGPLEAVRLINDRDAAIVDVRPVADYKKSHLLNAVNVPLARLEERQNEIGKDKSRPVIVYCALGPVAAEAAVKLAKLGYTEVYPLRGGINGWMSGNLPVTAK